MRVMSVTDSHDSRVYNVSGSVASSGWPVGLLLQRGDQL